MSTHTYTYHTLQLYHTISLVSQFVSNYQEEVTRSLTKTMTPSVSFKTFILVKYNFFLPKGKSHKIKNL